MVSAVGADERGEAQHGGGDVGAAAAETADVPLDVEDVAAETAARHLARLGLLGEDRRVAEGDPVGGGGGADHELAQPGRLLAGGEQLHGADDVLVLHRRPAALLRVGCGDQGEVHHRVDVEVGEQGHRAVSRSTRIRSTPVEQVAASSAAGAARVDADDPLDAGVGGEPGGDVGARGSG